MVYTAYGMHDIEYFNVLKLSIAFFVSLRYRLQIHGSMWFVKTPFSALSATIKHFFLPNYSVMIKDTNYISFHCSL